MLLSRQLARLLPVRRKRSGSLSDRLAAARGPRRRGADARRIERAVSDAVRGRKR